jgi:small subunit ribosomal protein S16
MLKIKLSRVGRKHQPAYRIVINERRDKRDGKYVEQVGFYNPVSKDLTFDIPLYEGWIAKGAIPTETVGRLFQTFTKKDVTKKEVVAK